MTRKALFGANTNCDSFASTRLSFLMNNILSADNITQELLIAVCQKKSDENEMKFAHQNQIGIFWRKANAFILELSGP